MSAALSAAEQCPDCFQPPRPDPLCRHCGFDWRTYQDTAHHLPLFAVLAEGRYTVGRVLGRPGGFGVVYAGWHNDLQSPVAIKEFFPAVVGVANRARDGQSVTARTGHERLFERWKARFWQEARLLAQLRNTPHIVMVHDVFQANDTVYLVMERLSGQSLTEQLGGLQSGPGGEGVTAQRLTPAQAHLLLEGLLTALERLHAAKVYHRDVTPNNIFLVKGDPRQAKLLDFGLASSGEDPRRGSISVGVGTPGFAAPEQAELQGDIGPATDFYALGATLYTALAGVAPPPAESRKAGLALRPLRERAPEVPAALAAVIDACLALESERRPQSVAELRARLASQTSLPAQSEAQGYETLLPEAPPKPLAPAQAPLAAPPIPPPPAHRRPARTVAMRVKKAVAGLVLVAAVSYAGLWLLDRYTPRVAEKPPKEQVEKAEQESTAPVPISAPMPVEKPVTEDPGVLRDPLKEGGEGPALVELAPGRFQMGDRQSGIGVREIAMPKRFALAKYEISVGEYQRCVQAGGCRAPHWQQSGGDYYKKLGEALTDGRHPIVGVSWYDALDYARWLSRQTGKHYRLPTEAEWEYAARAGTRSAYWWGDDIGHAQANCDGCGSPWDNQRTAPVDSFAANPWGLHNMAGNVAEWTCSPWADSYQGQEQICIDPADPSRRVIRGGAWDGEPHGLGTAARYGAYPPDYRSNNLGFRLARDE